MKTTIVTVYTQALNNNSGNFKSAKKLSKDLSCLVLLDALCQEKKSLASHRKTRYQIYYEKMTNGLFEAVYGHFEALKLKIRTFFFNIAQYQAYNIVNQQNNRITENWRFPKP